MVKKKDEVLAYMEATSKLIRSYIDEEKRLNERIAVLEEGLRPFAEAYRGSTPTTEHWQLNQYTGLTYGDLKRAHVLLCPAQGSAPPDAVEG